jgi:type VII secretion protein EccB
VYNRRDQVQAHTFLKNRLVAALLRTDPDGIDVPLRRTPMGVVSGSIVALLVVAGVLVVAILSPNSGSQNWRKPGALVVDKDTGASFVLAGGTLRPVLNLASARLLLGPKMTVAMVSGKALGGVPRGNPVGIVGAPDTLPAPGRDPVRNWTVCAVTVGADGANRPGVAVSVEVAGGQAPTPDERAVLARAADHSLHLVWHDHRHAVPNEWALRAIGIDPAAAIDVRDSWLDALPAGPDLNAPVASRGQPGPVVDGHPTTTGQLLVVPDAMPHRQHYLVVPDGLIPVSELVATLVLGDPATARAYGSDRVAPVEVSPAAIATTTMVPAPAWQAQLPPAPPAVLHGDPAIDGGVPCLRTVTGPTPAGPRLVVTTAPAGASPDGPGVTRDARVADRVAIGPGAGLLARSAPAPGVTGAGLHLITEGGVRFPVGSPDAAAALGIPADQASAIPTQLTELLPTGPLLSVAP